VSVHPRKVFRKWWWLQGGARLPASSHSDPIHHQLTGEWPRRVPPLLDGNPTHGTLASGCRGSQGASSW
jgi:hypothetical protein